MCFYCDQFGDKERGDGYWYLNPDNYARNMYKTRAPGKGFAGAETGLETGAGSGPGTHDLIRAIENDNKEEYDKMLSLYYEKRGWDEQGKPQIACD